MVSCIIDTEKQSVFHIDANKKWVQKEFEGFAQANAGRYKLFSLRQPDCALIAEAVGGKLIVQKGSLNAYVPVERRATAERLRALEHAFLIQATSEKDGYRLTRYGESAALVILKPEPDPDPEPPVRVSNIWFTIGGSHRQYQKDNAKIKAAKLPAHWVGPVAMGSKLQQVSIAPEYEAQMVALGFKKSRRQPLPPPKAKRK